MHLHQKVFQYCTWGRCVDRGGYCSLVAAFLSQTAMTLGNEHNCAQEPPPLRWFESLFTIRYSAPFCSFQLELFYLISSPRFTLHHTPFDCLSRVFISFLYAQRVPVALHLIRSPHLLDVDDMGITYILLENF